MSTVELAPKGGEIIQVVEGEVQLGNELRLSLECIKADAAKIVVHDKASSTEAKRIAKRGDDDMNAVIAAMEPERLKRKRWLDEWTALRDDVIAQIASVVDPLSVAARKFDIAEVEAAQEEQRKLNAGKRAENKVQVKPDLTPISGTRFVVRYRAEVIDESKIKRQFMKADIQAIEKLAREDHDPLKTERTVGGVRIKRV